MELFESVSVSARERPPNRPAAASPLDLRRSRSRRIVTLMRRGRPPDRNPMSLSPLATMA